MAITRIGNPAIADQRGVNFRNIIINGDMSIAQRGTSFTTTGSYPVDRFSIGYGVTGGTFTITQDSSSPADFNKSIKFLVGTGASAGSSEQAFIGTTFEGNNTSYLNFGTSDAKTQTLSFWVRSSLTGTFCVALINNAFDRSYIAEYSISSADTWEKKTITINGDTSGTWVGAVNTRSMLLRFDLGSGSSFNTTAGAWQSGSYRNTSSQTNLVNTSGATFYITGVQLEVGQVASDFEFLPYDVNLDRCYRYYQNLPYAFDTPICNANAWASTTAYGVMHLFSTMRTRPSLDQVTGTSYYRFYNTGDSGDFFDSFTIQSEGNGNVVRLQNTDSISATAGDGGWFTMVNGSSYLAFDAEL